MRYRSVGIAAQISGEREKAPHVVARARAITRRYPVRVLPAEYPEVLWFIKLKEGLSLSQPSYKTGVVYVQFTVSCEIGCLIVTPFPHSYPMLRNIVSGAEIGLPGRISAGF